MKIEWKLKRELSNEICIGTMEYKSKQCIGTIEISVEDNILFGKIISYRGDKINDLILYQGETQEELEKDFKEAVEDYVEIREMKNSKKCCFEV